MLDIFLGICFKSNSFSRTIRLCLRIINHTYTCSNPYMYILYDSIEHPTIIQSKIWLWTCRKTEHDQFSHASQMAIIRWVDVSILLAVLLARRWQMTLARYHFTRRTDLIANGWFDVGPTPLAQQALHMPT